VTGCAAECLLLTLKSLMPAFALAKARLMRLAKYLVLSFPGNR